MSCCSCSIAPPLLHFTHPLPTPKNPNSLPLSPFRISSKLTVSSPAVICHYRGQDSFYVPSYAYTFSDQFHSFDSNSETLDDDELQEASRFDRPSSAGLFANMWWVDMKAALGQRINVEGIRSSVSVLLKQQHLALPHVSVRDITYIDWEELSKRGFKGVVFDKDNTLTVPYSLKLWGPLESSTEHCKSVFGTNVAVFSNSAGLYEYDHDYSKARALEKAIGITVIRHSVKKPAGTAEEIEKHFGCRSSQLIMIGDRPFIDVVYGNRNGFFTILTEPFSLSEEPFIVRQVRKLEVSISKHWFTKGLRPISHKLLPDANQCIKKPVN